MLAFMDNTGGPRLEVVASLRGLGDMGIAVSFASEMSGGRAFAHHPEAAFLVLSPDGRWMRGSLNYTRREDMEADGRCYFFDLVSVEETRKLSLQMIFLGRLLSRVKSIFITRGERRALTEEAYKLFSEPDAYKFICWEENGNLSDIVPVPQAVFTGMDRIIFAPLPYGEDFTDACMGAKGAVLCVNPKMTYVLLAGVLIMKGVFHIEHVYGEERMIRSDAT